MASLYLYNKNKSISKSKKKNSEILLHFSGKYNLAYNFFSGKYSLKIML